MAEAKIPKATDAAKHKPGGGNVEICQHITGILPALAFGCPFAMSMVAHWG